MKLESRRERAERLKKQRRSTLAGMIIAIIVVVALGVVLWRGKAGLEEKNADYQAQITAVSYTHLDVYKRQAFQLRKPLPSIVPLPHNVKPSIPEALISAVKY